MKKNAFIIAEYNPFHNGHKYHIEETKKAGAENVICIMNGNFVQRGEPALCSKLIRAQAAVINGADLVIELPVKYGIADASHFARGGVQTAISTGLDGTLSFGACAEPEELQQLSELSDTREFISLVESITEREGKNYPAAFRKAVASFNSDLCNITDDANNILGLEYIKAIKGTENSPDYHVIKREESSSHDSTLPTEDFASAKYIREKIFQGKTDDAAVFMPDSAAELLRQELISGHCTENRELFDKIAISYLLHLKADDFTHINGVSQGLENRIVSTIPESSTLEYLYDHVKTKRFTHSRIRQIILSALLGVTREDVESSVSYIRVLAFGEKGKNLLREMRQTAKVPVITNLSDITEHSSLQAQKDKYTDYLAGKTFELCKRIPENGNSEFLLKPYIAYR